MEILKHEFGKTSIWYLVNNNKQISMFLIPSGSEKYVKKEWEKENGAFDARAKYIHQWNIGNLVHLHLVHHPITSGTLKFSKSTQDMKFDSQKVEKNGDCVKIITELESEEGYKVIHTVSKYTGYNAFMVDCEFINNSGKEVTIDMITSVSMDNISPFQKDDAPGKYRLHRFKGGWSLEGKHIYDDIEDLALEKSYAGCFLESEKFGSLGGYPVERYFPMAVLEDKEYNVCWAVQLAHNSSWQMELTRQQDTMSLSAGLADCNFGLWYKNIKSGEHFKTPKAYISVSGNGYEEACQNAVSLGNIACDAYGEKGLPVCYNEFCTTWGEPTQEKIMSYANMLKDKKVKYVVIDAGWSTKCYGGQGGNGEWEINTDIFPDMKGMCDKIRKMGMIPGIWFEMEVTTNGADHYTEKYDDLHLKRNGVVINVGGFRSFWDFRKPEVIEYLTQKVIGLLKENGFGYIKVDYNANLGNGCDGAESLGEGLREHEEAVAEFFKKIKREIPDIIIENCASGGHRLEPQMMGLSAMASFSDAHEADEIPYIAANLHNLILPRQSLIWAVVHENDTLKRIKYSMAATFLGRICLSGDVDKLSEEQWKVIDKAFDFYNGCENIIKCGITRVYGNRGNNIRYPNGTQAVLRENDKEALLIVHSFSAPDDKFVIEFDCDMKTADEFYNENVTVSGSRIIIDKMEEYSALAVRLIKV
ncbi:MAG: glycoside hydrolase family 36 protein [Clostridia bacterium]|nr:glycoside hydrolase family 36 protein [Clostridia bacterium]